MSKKKQQQNQIVIEHEMVIPQGTVFQDCSGVTRTFGTGNFRAYIALGKDAVIEVCICEEGVRYLKSIGKL
jgi:hypothetical protein